MKYLTKEWYRTMGDSGLGVMLQPDERAKSFSESLFQAIWEEKLNGWLQEREEICPILDQIYEEEGERRAFVAQYRRELDQFLTRTPAPILQKVADPRLLALGVCTEEVFRDFEQFQARCEEQTVQTMREVWNMQASQGLDKIWTGEHSLHDSVVESLKREGEDLTVRFRREAEPWPQIEAIRFRDAKILKQEQPVENTWWLYDEIWPAAGGGYEIHGLLWRDDDVFELTLLCRETELLWTVPMKTED